MVYHIYYLFFFLFFFLFFLEVLQCRRIEKFTFSMDQMERMQIDQLDAECFMVNLCFSATLATLQHSGYLDVDIVFKDGDIFRRFLFVVFEEYSKRYKRSGMR